MSNEEYVPTTKQSAGTPPAADTTKLVDTLTQVFETFEERLKTQAEPADPFSTQARVAVDRFKALAAGLRLDPMPSVPTGFKVKRVKNEATLTWDPGVEHADGFRVWRCTGAECTDFKVIGELGPGVGTFQDTGLTTGTTYRYVLSAYNIRGDRFAEVKT